MQVEDDYITPRKAGLTVIFDNYTITVRLETHPELEDVVRVYLTLSDYDETYSYTTKRPLRMSK